MLRTGLVTCLVALLAAGCGGSPRPRSAPSAPKLPAALAQQWAGEADEVAVAATAGDGCRAQTLARTLASQVAANSSRVPNRLRTALLSSVTELLGRINCVQVQKPPAGPKPKPKKPKGHGPGQGPGHGHGPGKGGGGGDQGDGG